MSNWLDELDRLERDATAGPWAYNFGEIFESGDNYDPDDYPILIREENHAADRETQKDNCRMVCLLRNYARELIDAKRENEKLRGLLREAQWPDMEGRCNICGGMSPEYVPEDEGGSGHLYWCRLAEVLRDGKQSKSESES